MRSGRASATEEAEAHAEAEDGWRATVDEERAALTARIERLRAERGGITEDRSVAAIEAEPAPDGWFDARKGPAKYDATAAETAWGPR